MVRHEHRHHGAQGARGITQTADRRKDEFLATLAHELRNPLAPIRNALHIMKSGRKTLNGLEDERAMAERQVTHLTRLVEDLMDVSRINTGKIELRKEVVDLSVIVRRAVDSAALGVQERGHRLTVNLPPEPIRLEADSTRLEQVLWNLLNNATKYTDRGGEIELSVVPVGRHRVSIHVRDSGIGIPPEIASYRLRHVRPGRAASGPLARRLGNRPESREEPGRTARGRHCREKRGRGAWKRGRHRPADHRGVAVPPARRVRPRHCRRPDGEESSSSMTMKTPRTASRGS